MFKTYFRFNKIQDNPFRIMNLMLLIFIVLWLGYINQNFLISSFSSLGIFTFFYYQNIPMKHLIKRMFFIGCGLLFAFVFRNVINLCFMVGTFCCSCSGFCQPVYFAVVPYFKTRWLIFCDAFGDGNKYAVTD